MVHVPLHRVSRLTAAFGVVLSMSIPGALAAQPQEAVVSVRENLRAEPNGVVIAVVGSGTSMQVVREQGNWVEVVLDGWVWSQSLTARDGGNYDFRVGVAEGENLRQRPSGEIIARLEEGALLEEIERVPGWIHVRRQAWMWAASVELRESEAASPDPTRPSSIPALSVFRAGNGSPLLASPDGDTLTVLEPGTELAVTARQGNWARVRMEGWVWMPPSEAAQPGGDAAGASLTLAAVHADPDAYVGRLVTWELQFVSVEEAEAVRTDFYEGEAFLLTRPVGDETTRFVYVAISPEEIPATTGLTPLERLTVVGRIRTGASALTNTPILDLVELRRAR